ncbi:MAG: hypothetical protein Q4C34_05240 [Bacteroidales bacterium]|nr:hypothetical protein [Bacteroidales bacterium]
MKTNTITFHCPDCDKDFDVTIDADDINWEIAETSERSMGIERRHQGSLYVESPCGEGHEVTIDVWEYPEGSLQDEIEVNADDLTVIDHNLDINTIISID